MAASHSLSHTIGGALLRELVTDDEQVQLQHLVIRCKFEDNPDVLPTDFLKVVGKTLHSFSILPEESNGTMNIVIMDFWSNVLFCSQLRCLSISYFSDFILTSKTLSLAIQLPTLVWCSINTTLDVNVLQSLLLGCSSLTFLEVDMDCAGRHLLQSDTLEFLGIRSAFPGSNLILELDTPKLRWLSSWHCCELIRSSLEWIWFYGYGRFVTGFLNPKLECIAFNNTFVSYEEVKKQLAPFANMATRIKEVYLCFGYGIQPGTVNLASLLEPFESLETLVIPLCIFKKFGPSTLEDLCNHKSPLLLEVIHFSWLIEPQFSLEFFQELLDRNPAVQIVVHHACNRFLEIQPVSSTLLQLVQLFPGRAKLHFSKVKYFQSAGLSTLSLAKQADSRYAILDYCPYRAFQEART